MQKEINPVVMIGAIVAVVIVIAIVGFRMFGRSSGGTQARPGDYQTVPAMQSRPPSAPGGAGTAPAAPAAPAQQ